MTRSRRAGRIAAVLIGLGVLLGSPVIALAHPLGNFTINHYAGIRVEPTRVLLDVVVDQAEIPAFQARLAFDLDGDGEVSDEETEAGRVTACEELAAELSLVVADAPQTLVLTDAGLSFPPGVGGLSTMRLVCGYRADLAAPIEGPTALSFSDASFADRIGWREIVITGSGVTIAAVTGAVRTESLSQRLTVYPEALLDDVPLDQSLDVSVAPGAPELPPFTAPDASPIPGGGVAIPASPDPSPGPSGEPIATAAPSAVVGGGTPGGVGGGDLPAIFREADLTPAVLLVSLLTAGALGAGHALTPGHGKTLMAAYLVGSRGTVLHAAGLGLSVTVSHTLGILVLAALVVGAQDILAPDLVVRGAPVVAGISIVAIGGWMLATEIRRRRRAAATAHDHGHEHDHDHPHEHEHEHESGHDHPHEHAEPAADTGAPTGLHRHGGIAHSHAPVDGSTITWRSLFVLGLAGGLIPSTSALLILLGSIAAGRAGFGFVLVVAFGLGMALVLGGIGVALVLARGRVDRLSPTSRLGRVTSFIPLAAAVLVFSLGLYLTAQAITAAPVL